MPVSSNKPPLQTPWTDLAACRALLCGGSRSFYAASHLLPVAIRESAITLYAFCREADDAVDEGGDPVLALRVLEARLTSIYAGRPGASATDRALARTVSRHALPRELLDALLEGFAWDAAGRRYDTLSEVLEYSARVAGSVGVMMAVLMGVRSPAALARAADLGAAMQLTNIARDVGEDARAGRLYLPRDWLREAGIDPDQFVARPAHSEALAAVIRRLLAEADRLYQRADSGIAQLPAGCRGGIYAARLLYAEIGAQLARHGHDAVTARSVVPAGRKLALLLRVTATAGLPTDRLREPAMREVAFLVSAVDPVLAGKPDPGTQGNPWSRFKQRVTWMLDLFEALEERERAARNNFPGQVSAGRPDAAS
jgi:phytoene synthase